MSLFAGVLNRPELNVSGLRVPWIAIVGVLGSLAELGLSLRLLPKEALSLVVAGALISITLNPLVFVLAAWLGRRAPARVDGARRQVAGT